MREAPELHPYNNPEPNPSIVSQNHPQAGNNPFFEQSACSSYLPTLELLPHIVCVCVCISISIYLCIYIYIVYISFIISFSVQSSQLLSYKESVKSSDFFFKLLVLRCLKRKHFLVWTCQVSFGKFGNHPTVVTQK